MLNLEFKNLTNGNFSEHHVKVDVYLDGVFISNYQWNPFYSMNTEDKIKDKEIYSLFSRRYPGMAKRMFNVFCGKVWGKTLLSSSIKEIKDFFIEKNKIEMPEIYEVEGCLISDAVCYLESIDFDDFCANFGYSNDSIKAQKIYENCEQIYLKLIKSIGVEEFKRLQEIHAED